MSHVSICVPYIDKIDILKNTISSIRNKTGDTAKYKIFLMDNGSEKQVGAGDGNLVVINSPENLGFGRALNLLITEALKENPDTHILVCNDDIEILQLGWLDRLVDCVETYPKAGVVGPVCLYPNGTVQHAGAYINRIFTGQHFQEIPKERKEFEYIPFVVVLLHNNLVKDLIKAQGSVFDDNIKKAYSEDVDVCYSARKYGYVCVLEPTVRIVHLEGTSQKIGVLGNRANISELQNTNKEYVAKKWEDYDSTEDKKYKVCFVSRLAGNLSYQQVLKNIAPRLDKDNEFDVSLLPEETVYSPEHLPADWELRKLRQKPFDEKRICIRYSEGQFGYLAYSRDVIYTTLETWGTHIPFEWKNNINKFKQCWVTCNRVKDVFQASGITIPIKVVPHGIDFKLWDYNVEPYHNPHLPKFLFFMNDMYGSRKNMDIVVKAFCEIFKDNKEVGLFIQSSGLVTQLEQIGYAEGVERNLGTQYFKTKVITRWLSNNGWDGRTQIFVFDDWVSQETLVKLYARMSVVICMGNEGFGLVGLQSAAMKKPLIHLNEGGFLEYCPPSMTYPVEVGDYVPSRQMWIMQQYINGLWAEPNYESLKKQMQFVYEQTSANETNAESLYNYVRENFTWDKVIEGIKENIKCLDS